ncbi:stalk domain-containing protein [Sedimentibacter sp.]|uniref:stalk domain-containing protein n=1 Tax=Sedimentibacter sp. TaxID=1960295 RepID=UPI0028A6F9AA|nr:stalk domain-containing protein [Sedimentibacter sp.]
MKKKYYVYLAIIISFILIFNNSSSVYASGADVLSEQIKISFNGNILDVSDSAPYVNESKTMMLPLRKIGEILGFDVTWQEGKEVRLQKDNENIFLQMDSNYYNEDYVTPTNCLLEIKGNRSYAPSSFFEEMLNVSVDYHENQGFVIVEEIDKENRSLSIDRSSIDDGDIELWENTFEDYLKDDLWINLYAYDAGHYLMIPMHAAFTYNQENWKNQFSDHFERFVKVYTYNQQDIVEERLDRLHYLYLASQFVVLCEESKSEHLIPDGLVHIINEEIYSMWEREPAWQWNRDSFEGGIKERIRWKLDNRDVNRSYYRAIIDEDFFVLAIGANLYNYENSVNDSYINKIDYKKEIVGYAYEVFCKESVITEGGNWVFQPGVKKEHPDYTYAGNDKKSDDIMPMPVEGIASDSSHSHRFPLWINSFIGAYESAGDIDKMDYFIDIRTNLEKQFYENVLVKPNEEFNGYRTTNFMDGRNGIYRWNYLTQGQGNGYGPFELSGTFTLGWWSLLKTERISEAYYETAQRFPLYENVIDIYVGPNTTRERHKIVKLPDSYYNGANELVCRLASKLK